MRPRFGYTKYILIAISIVLFGTGLVMIVVSNAYSGLSLCGTWLCRYDSVAMNQVDLIIGWTFMLLSGFLLAASFIVPRLSKSANLT